MSHQKDAPVYKNVRYINFRVSIPLRWWNASLWIKDKTKIKIHETK
jgi:hypothetical protein